MFIIRPFDRVSGRLAKTPKEDVPPQLLRKVDGAKTM